MEVPQTHYARSGELAIAYQVHGAGDVDVLFSGSTASNVETSWLLPEAAQLFERLGRFSRVIRFDRRDSGCSDPYMTDLTLEVHADDALAVMDAVGSERAVLLGALDGGRSLAALAATRPERVDALVTFGATPRGAAALSPGIEKEIQRALTSARADWPGPALALFAPEWCADPVRRDRLARYMRTAVSPRQAARLLLLSLTSDITDVLPLVQARTLVLRAQDAAWPPREAVRRFAELIPGSQYRELPGNAVLIFAMDPDLMADTIEEFVTGTAPRPVSTRVLATVLFTDIVGATEEAARSGDRLWSAVLDRYLAASAAAVLAHGGETVKTTGDGVLALFTGPAQGVRCAQRIISDSDDLGLSVRSGLHTGEVERTGDDVAGLAVHLTARIMSHARANEILVSRTVRDLVIGSELTFTDRGRYELKGIPEAWALYSAAA
ncbi:MAG: adenylate/guanylate cyclase domain-containing protein [Solirubrobacteraceae bacterium]